jgi:hypothetical protein
MRGYCQPVEGGFWNSRNLLFRSTCLTFGRFCRPNRTDAIRNVPPPKDVKGIARFWAWWILITSLFPISRIWPLCSMPLGGEGAKSQEVAFSALCSLHCWLFWFVCFVNWRERGRFGGCISPGVRRLSSADCSCISHTERPRTMGLVDLQTRMPGRIVWYRQVPNMPNSCCRWIIRLCPASSSSSAVRQLCRKSFSELINSVGKYPRSKSVNTVLLACVDSFFTWLVPVREATSLATIKALRGQVFWSFSVPSVVVPGNARCFTS